MKKNNKKKKAFMGFLTTAFIGIGVILVGIVLLFGIRKISGGLKKIDDGDKEKLSSAGGVSIEYSNKVLISDGKATIKFNNPSNSINSIKLQLILDKKVIAESAIIKPGYGVEELDLDRFTIEPGTYKGIFKLLFYEPDNKTLIEKVNSVIDVDITVQ